MKKGECDMPNHILTMDVMDEMLENISVIKLNTYIQMSKNWDD